MLLFFTAGPTLAQTAEPTYNDSKAKVGTHTLPYPLVNQAKKRVTTKAAWRSRRQERQRLFAEHVYGQTPAQTVTLRFESVETDSSALDGRAIRKQTTTRLSSQNQ